MNKDALKSLNITHILIVARSLNPAFAAEFNYKKIEGNHMPAWFIRLSCLHHINLECVACTITTLQFLFIMK